MYIYIYIYIYMRVCIYIYIYIYTYNIYINKHLLMFASVFISFYFLLAQFSLSISSNLIFSLSMGLRKIQFFDLAYKLTD